MRVPVERWMVRRVHWIGMAGVYLGTLTLLALLTTGGGFAVPALAALVLRAAAAVALGIGICGLERWAWAVAVCLSALHLGVDGLLALIAGWRCMTLPSSVLSWQPVFHGLTADNCGGVAIVAGVGAVLAALVLYSLWTAREQFDVPYRRAFTVLSREGMLPTLAVASVDLYLVLGWWLSAARGPIL